MKILFIALLFLPASLLAQTYTTPIRVNQDKSLRADKSPMMKMDRQGNIYVAWVSGADGSGNGPISMAASTDGGATFSTQSVVCPDANCNSNFQRTAQFVIDTKGNIHLIWMGLRVKSPKDGMIQPDIWYVRSQDKGKTWTMPISVCDADDSSIYAQDFPSIACDSSDNLYVSFLDSRETQRKQSSNVHLYFTKSVDGGKTWSGNKKADVFSGGIGGTCECCTETMACSPDGQIYIVFRSNINNLRDIWLARSYDKGVTFQPALKIVTGDWNISACPVSGPKISLDDSDGAHIVWRDARDNTGGKIHLYYAFISKGSTTTPMNTMFDASGAQSANYPDVAIYGKYRVIAYETFNYGMRYILSSNSAPLVDNRPVTVNGNSNKSFANVLFASDGTRYLCWQDDMSDAGDIYFCKETSSLATPLTEVTILSPLDNATQVPTPVMLSWTKVAGATSYHVFVVASGPPTVTIYDTSGISGTTLTATKLMAGTRYAWSVRAASGQIEGPASLQSHFTTAGSASVTMAPQSDLNIYPNPISTENPTFTIERSGIGAATVRIVDLLGREVAAASIEAGMTRNSLSLPKLASGVYCFVLYEAPNVSKRLVVVK